MRQSIQTGVLLILLGAAKVLADPGDLPQPFTASYSLHSMGTRFATMKRSFTRLEDGNYQYHSVTNTVGLMAMLRRDQIIETSVWRYTAGRLQPMLYSYMHTGGKKNRNVEIDFDWSARKIRNSVNGSSWQMPIQAYIMDKLLYQLAIMVDLAKGTDRISYAIADGGKIKTYDFELLGAETVNTPIGNLKALKMERHKPGATQKTVIWCARELGFLPIKVENTEGNGRRTMAVIETLDGISASGVAYPAQ